MPSLSPHYARLFRSSVSFSEQRNGTVLMFTNGNERNPLTIMGSVRNVRPNWMENGRIWMHAAEVNGTDPRPVVWTEPKFGVAVPVLLHVNFYRTVNVLKNPMMKLQLFFPFQPPDTFFTIFLNTLYGAIKKKKKKPWQEKEIYGSQKAMMK